MKELNETKARLATAEYRQDGLIANTNTRLEQVNLDLENWSRRINRSVDNTNKRVDTGNLESEIITRRIEANEKRFQARENTVERNKNKLLRLQRNIDKIETELQKPFSFWGYCLICLTVLVYGYVIFDIVWSLLEPPISLV